MLVYHDESLTGLRTSEHPHKYDTAQNKANCTHSIDL